MRFIKWVLPIGCLLLTVSCAERYIQPPSVPSGNSGQTGVTSLSPITVVVSIKWEGEASYSTLDTLTIPTGTAVGSTITEYINIPEGQLYYSDLQFEVSAIANECEQVIFRPYRYIASTVDADFNPGWATGIDCTVGGDDQPGECWGGAAPFMLDDFPDITGEYFLAATGGSGVWELESANSVSYGSNRMTANNYATPAVAKTSGQLIGGGEDAYEANSLVDWRFECRDEYYELRFTIVLVIDDQNPAAGGDDFGTWP